ncbi:hypothetical protein K439DRAFT_1349836 [Ramaria rubella]|nr:hypothetical protein K439DRAFT_1349836 [Ramaria rubella]
MEGPLIPTFMLTVAALVLLVLVTFSVPFVSSFYFLRATIPGDTIRFGIWGFCFQESGECTIKELGYHWDPEIIPWLTKVLVFAPIAAIFTLILVIALLPSVFLHIRRDTIFPPPLYSLFAIPAGITSLLAFVFMIALSTVAKNRFHDAGAVAAYGPLPWMLLVATIILVGLMLYTGCGATWRGPFGQMSPHIRNRWSAVYAY